MYKFHCFLIILIIKLNNFKIIKLPFKRKLNTNLNENNLIESLYFNEIYTKIEVGEPSEKFNIFIKLQQFPTFLITEDYLEAKSKTFNQNKSKSFEYIEQNSSINYYNFDFYHGLLSKDIFYLNDKKIKIEKLKFILAKDLSQNAIEYSGELGLKLQSHYSSFNNTINIIYQLKEKKIIDKFSFYLKYNKEDEGELIIGDYLHNIDNGFKENEFIFIQIPIVSNKLNYAMTNNLGYIENEKIINYTFFISLQYEFGLIQSIPEYYFKIKKKFFGNFPNECLEKEFKKENLKDKTFIYFVCSKKVDIKKFPNLIIENLEMKYNLTFNYEDLFFNYNDKNYFFIVFEKPFNSYQNWIFGKPFFKKYLILFDGDKKLIGLYKNYSKSINVNFLWIIIFILVLILIGAFIYIKYLLSLNKRKIRANELEDNYEYLPENIEKNKEEKLIKGISKINI